MNKFLFNKCWLLWTVPSRTPDSLSIQKISHSKEFLTGPCYIKILTKEDLKEWIFTGIDFKFSQRHEEEFENLKVKN